jgi:hypothetical protein
LANGDLTLDYQLPKYIQSKYFDGKKQLVFTPMSQSKNKLSAAMETKVEPLLKPVPETTDPTRRLTRDEIEDMISSSPSKLMTTHDEPILLVL